MLGGSFLTQRATQPEGGMARGFGVAALVWPCPALACPSSASRKTEIAPARLPRQVQGWTTGLRAALIFAALLPGVVAGAPSDDIKSLIDQSRAVDAYDLGKRGTRIASDDFFDYCFGIAAADSRHDKSVTYPIRQR